MVRRGDGYQLPGQGLKVCRLVRDCQWRDTNQLSGLEGIGGNHRPTGFSPSITGFVNGGEIVRL